VGSRSTETATPPPPRTRLLFFSFNDTHLWKRWLAGSAPSLKDLAERLPGARLRIAERAGRIAAALCGDRPERRDVRVLHVTLLCAATHDPRHPADVHLAMGGALTTSPPLHEHVVAFDALEHVVSLVTPNPPREGTIGYVPLARYLAPRPGALHWGEFAIDATAAAIESYRVLLLARATEKACWVAAPEVLTLPPAVGHTAPSTQPLAARVFCAQDHRIAPDICARIAALLTAHGETSAARARQKLEAARVLVGAWARGRTGVLEAETKRLLWLITATTADV
jgi:hypothetical protein